MHLVTVKSLICLLTGWSSTVFILLVNIFNHTFNLFLNNIVKKPIIDESVLFFSTPLYWIFILNKRLPPKCTHSHIYIYIYIYICVCVCVCVCA